MEKPGASTSAVTNPSMVFSRSSSRYHTCQAEVVFKIRASSRFGHRKILSMGGSVKAEWDRGVELRPGTVARAIFMGWRVTTDQLTSLVIAVFLAPCGDVIVLGRNPMGRAEWRCVHRATWPNLTYDVQLNRPFTKLQLFPAPSAGQGSTLESLEDELHLLQGHSRYFFQH